MKRWKKALSAFVIATVMSVGVGVIAGCNGCGKDPTPEGGGGGHDSSHTWATYGEYDYKADGENGHYRDCNDCDERETVDHHVYDNEQDATCNDCGYTRQIGGNQHGHDNWGEWKEDPSNENQHIRECQEPDCNEVDRGDHKDVSPADDKCDVCGHDMSDAPAIFKTLRDRSDNIVAETFTGKTAADFAVHAGFGTAGVYVSDAASTNVTGSALVIGGSGANADAVVDFGHVKELVEGYLEFKFDGTASGAGQGNHVDFYNGNKKVLEMMTGADKFTFKINGEDVATPALTAAKDTLYKVYFKFDLVSGVVTLTVNDTEVFAEHDANITALSGLKITTSNGGARKNTIDNIAVCGTEKTLADHIKDTLDLLKAAYEEYDLSEYQMNGGDLTAAYEEAADKIGKAQDFETVDAEYNACIASMAAIDNDVVQSFKNAIAKAEDDLKDYAAKAIADNNIEDAEVLANIEEARDKGLADIAAAADEEAIKAAYDAAVAEIDGYVETASMELPDYKSDRATRLESYADKAKEGIYNDEYKGKIDDTVALHSANINSEELTTRAGVDAAYKAGMDAIDALVTELKAKKFAVIFEDTDVATQEVIYGGNATRPSNPANRDDKRFVEWYADELLTQVFDFDAPVYAEVTVYAKWQEADVTINYYVGDSIWKTVKAFSDETPVLETQAFISGKKLVQWCTTDALDAEYEVPVNWTKDQVVNVYGKFDWKSNDELTEYDAWIVADLENPEISADGVINDNKLYLLTTDLAPANAVYDTVAANVPSAALANGANKSFSKAWKGANVTSGTVATYSLFVMAKEDCKVTLYLSDVATDYNGNREGTFYAEIGSAKTSFAMAKGRNTLVKVVVDLKAGETAKIYFDNTGSSGGSVVLFGVEAALADEFSNTTVLFHDADGGVHESVAWSTLKNVADIILANGDPSKDGSAFKGWATTAGADTAVDLATLTTVAGETLELYPIFKQADGSVTLVYGADDEVTYPFVIGDAIPTPVKAGYKFEGWYEDDAFATKLEATVWAAEHDGKTLYAKFEVASINWAFDSTNTTLSSDKKTATKTAGDAPITLYSGSQTIAINAISSMNLGGVSVSNVLIGKTTTITASAAIKITVYFDSVSSDGSPNNGTITASLNSDSREYSCSKKGTQSDVFTMAKDDVLTFENGGNRIGFYLIVVEIL